MHCQCSSRGRRMQGKYEIITIFDQYLALSRTDARQSHSYYGKRIRNRNQAFEWY